MAKKQSKLSPYLKALEEAGRKFREDAQRERDMYEWIRSLKRDLEVAEGVHEVARNRRLASEKAAWDLLTYGKIPEPKDQQPRAWDPANLLPQQAQK